jgi:hypothetical protein
MSHTMNIQLELHDKDALLAACQRLGLQVTEGRHKLYSSTEEGLGVFLPGWKYPVVIKQDGSVAYDDYNGRWGNINELNKLKAYYGLEKAKAEARKKGYSVYETYNNHTQELELRIRMEG